MKVAYAELQAGVRMHGGTFTTLNNEKCRGIEMTWDPKGLVCTWKGHSYIVPDTNIKIVQLSETLGVETSVKRGKAAVSANA